MNKVKTILLKILIFAICILIALYFLFLTVLPRFLSSHTFLTLFNNSIEKKIGIVITSEKLNVKTYPSLYIQISAEDFNILNSEKQELLKVKNAVLLFDLKKQDFTVKGEDIPIADIMASLLYYQKFKDKSKKFIENFYDYSGKMQVDLKFTKHGIFGECIAQNLAAKTVLFDVPILFKHVPFKFNGRDFSGGAYGFLGGEKVYADFNIIKTGSPQQKSKGTVQSVLTNKSVGKYVPNASIKGITNASVDWYIKNKKTDVNYKLYIPQGSDIYYKNVNMGLEDKNRKLFVQTLKHDDKLAVTNYEYSTKTTKIIMGDGLFTKINGHLKPDYITVKTENDAPVSIAGSFYKYINGGIFNGNLKYDFDKNKITGNFNIKNSGYKDYLLDNAKISATDTKVIIEANGKYKKSPFSANIKGINDFNNKIKINTLNLSLDSLKINPSHKQHNKTINFNEEIVKEKTENFDIDLYEIKLNQLIYKRAVLSDILVTGSIKNDIFDFEAPDIKFAGGLLKAKGNYDFEKRTSNVVFSAQNINSDTAAAALFNLPNQIKGTANASFNIQTKNGIADKFAHTEFSIKNGYLPKLGSTEFIIKQSKHIKKPVKFTLQDVVHLDVKNMKALKSDINGSFDSENDIIKNAHITSAQKYLSLLILGDYNMENQHADLQLFGKYNNKEISRIKVFFVPLSLIVKIVFRPEETKEKYTKQLNGVPDITADTENDISTFRVKLNGNPNKHDLKVEMKSIL